MASKSIVTALIAAGAFMASMSIASAQSITTTNSDSTSMTFTWDTAEFEERKGAKRIYRRLVRKARSACAWDEQTSFQKNPYDRFCVAEMTHRAVAQIGEADLLSRHSRSAQYRIAVKTLGMNAIASR